MSIQNETPCGACDIGVYNELACLNKAARAFGAMSAEERKNNIPRCKNFDRECIGAKDFDQLITEVDAHLEAITKRDGEQQ
ncbi:hypothetical protein KPE82_00395 [Acinetobacter baumannii]|uniref:hypothetical protein n=1 Tax=Acinetobacter baumannii TaxID=470 RepID=UPI001C0C3603|nr:hypothetical protein [Acinetobacter baumannii]MBU3094065.1 hypothetical protein [Acinetobacter baumannii]